MTTESSVVATPFAPRTHRKPLTLLVGGFLHEWAIPGIEPVTASV
jgi:hypothetical protein